MEKESFEHRISTLQVELDSCMKDIVEHVSSLYAPENIPTNLRNDPRNAVKILHHDVLDVLRAAQDRASYREKFASDIDNCKSLMDVIEKVSICSEKIAKCDDAVSGTDVRLASKLIAEVRVAVDALPGPNTEIGTGAVCSILRKEARTLKARFHAKLRRLLGNCIVCECGRVTVTKRLKGMVRGCGEDLLVEDGIELSDIWTSLISIDGAEDSVSGVVESIWGTLLRPLWKERKALTPSTFSNDERAEILFDNIVRDHALSSSSSSSSSGTSVLNGGSCDPAMGGGIHAMSLMGIGPCKMPLPQLLDMVAQVLAFMSNEILCSNEDVVVIAGAKLNGKTEDGEFSLNEALVETLTALVPKTEGELASFQRSLEKPCKEFESKLDALGLSSNSQPDGKASGKRAPSGKDSDMIGGKRNQPLSEVVAELGSRFAEMRRREILGKGRDLLLSDYHNTMLATGDASEDDPSTAGNIGDPTAVLEQSGSFSMQALQFEPCRISLAACRVLKLTHEVMKQACSSSPTLAALLYQSARDVLDLFIAIIPVRFADVIETVPRMGAVLYNDCYYMAHNCTLISHMYKEELSKVDPVLQDNAGFIDFIPRFRALGDKCLTVHVEEQRATLSELVTRIHVNPASEGSASHSKRTGGVRSAVAGAVGAVGGALLKSIGATFRDRDGGGLESLSTNIAPNMSISEKERIVGFGSSNSSSSAANSSAHENDEEAAALVVRHLERLRGQWQGVLQDTVYERLMGHLYDGVLRAVMQPALETDCISESACEDLGRVFRALQRARTVFPSASSHTASGTVSGSGSGNVFGISSGTSGNNAQADDVMTRVTPSWSKFCALTDLLEYSLSEVAEWLPRRKFASFTASEMTSLIKALFEDTPRRDSILKGIMEMAS